MSFASFSLLARPPPGHSGPRVASRPRTGSGRNPSWGRNHIHLRWRRPQDGPRPSPKWHCAHGADHRQFRPQM